MSDVFILQNQDGCFLNKQKEWTDGRDAGQLYRSPHHDEALNHMVEINSKDYTQRINIVECPLSDKRQPMLDPDTLPAPLPEVQAELSQDLEAMPESELTFEPETSSESPTMFESAEHIDEASDNQAVRRDENDSPLVQDTSELNAENKPGPQNQFYVEDTP